MGKIPNYDSVRSGARRFYNSIGRRFAPALKEEVHFSAVGFNHIIHKSARTVRQRGSQIVRFELLRHAVKLVETATTCRTRQIVSEFNVKVRKKRVRKVKPVFYWSLVGTIKGSKIEVVLRKVGHNGAIHFWSVMPKD